MFITLKETIVSQKNILKKIDILYVYLSFLVIIIGFVIFGYVYINIYHYDGLEGEYELSAPLSNGKLLGTDDRGRDLLLRLALSIKSYFVPGLLSVSISVIFGLILGILTSGTGANKVEKFGNSIGTLITDILESFPKYITILLIITIWANKVNFYWLMVVLGLINSAQVGKLISTKIRSLVKSQFVETAQALGISKAKIIGEHILFYNCRSIVLIQASLFMAEVILIEIGLSYLAEISSWTGVTIGEPFPSFGNILVIWRSNPNAWWIEVFTTLIVMANILVFYLIADTLSKRFKLKRTITEFE